MTMNRCRRGAAGRRTPMALSVGLAFTAITTPSLVTITNRVRPPGPPEIVLDKNVEARMRDGVILRCDTYRPSADGRYPALLQRTPYSKNDPEDVERFHRISRRGYVVVVQDTRGRYTSEGVARPHDEAEDGYDTVEWVAGLPYVNGKVGMFGGSYLATTQLLAASLRPPHLVALFPSNSYANRYDMVFQGGAFYLADGLGWNLGQALDVRRRTLTPDADRDRPIELDDRQRALLQQHWLWFLPLNRMDALDLRRFHPAYFDLLAHPSYDDYWTRFNIAGRHRGFATPAFHLTGWFDSLLNGTLRNFTGLRAGAATELARANQRLLVGPWTHARPTRESISVADLNFGAEAGVDAESLLLEWFDGWLKDQPRAPGAPVRVFVMGANEWRDEDDWPPKRAVPTAYFLHSRGGANTLGGDGALSTALPSDEPPDRFVYDPWDPVPTGGLGGYSRLPIDQRPIESRADVLVYSTPVLESPLEVTGHVSLTLWVASGAPDTDFTAKLVDVYPGGPARPLCDGVLRARYRLSHSVPQLLTPGLPVELSIDLGATSNRFNPGHRIRLEVSSSNFPRFDRNPNTGHPFGQDADLARAEQTVFHDGVRPSRLQLPIVPIR